MDKKHEHQWIDQRFSVDRDAYVFKCKDCSAEGELTLLDLIKTGPIVQMQSVFKGMIREVST